MIKNIHPEAKRLLEEAGYHWDNYSNAFRKIRNPEKEKTENYRNKIKTRISYEYLEDHYLAGKASPEKRDAGLQCLRRKLFSQKS